VLIRLPELSKIDLYLIENTSASGGFVPGFLDPLRLTGDFCPPNPLHPIFLSAPVNRDTRRTPRDRRTHSPKCMYDVRRYCTQFKAFIATCVKYSQSFAVIANWSKTNDNNYRYPKIVQIISSTFVTCTSSQYTCPLPKTDIILITCTHLYNTGIVWRHTTVRRGSVRRRWKHIWLVVQVESAAATALSNFSAVVEQKTTNRRDTAVVEKCTKIPLSQQVLKLLELYQ